MIKTFLSRHIKFLFILLLLSVTGLMGCESTYTKKFQASNSDYGSRSDSREELLEGDRMYGPTIQGGYNHQNKKLQYSKELSTIISELPGVSSSIVMLTDRNAYAAIIYDNSATGSKGTGTPDESDHTGTTRGMYNTHTGNQTVDPNQIATGFNSYYTENNPDHLSSRMKQQIALTLREENPRLLEVYITANREFINQMNVYYVESIRGVSLNGYLEDFNSLVTKHFGIKK